MARGIYIIYIIVKTITNNHEYINYDYFYNTEIIK